MAYRARLLGASLRIAAGWMRGTAVICRVPLAAALTAGGAAAPEPPR
jgi:hypothetical protein